MYSSDLRVPEVRRKPDESSVRHRPTGAGVSRGQPRPIAEQYLQRIGRDGFIDRLADAIEEIRRRYGRQGVIEGVTTAAKTEPLPKISREAFARLLDSMSSPNRKGNR